MRAVGSCLIEECVLILGKGTVYLIGGNVKELLSLGICSVFLLPCVPCACQHDTRSEYIGADEGLGILDAPVYM